MGEAAQPVPEDLDRYEMHDGNSNKFWMIKQQDGAGLVATWYGRCGTSPRDGVYKRKGTVPSATKFVESKLRQKQKEGYKLVGKGYSQDAYDADGLPTEGEPPQKKLRVQNKFVPFRQLQSKYGASLEDVEAVGEVQTVTKDTLCDCSETVKTQLEVLRQLKFFDSDAVFKTLPECFAAVDDGCCVVMEIKGGTGLELAYWSARHDNEYMWLLMKTGSTYQVIANGEDHFLEWGGSGTTEEEDYEPGEAEERSCQKFLNAVGRLRFPDDADLFEDE